MRLCVSLSRGVAAPLGCVICLQLGDVAVFSLCAQYFLNVRGGGGITTLGAFHTIRKPCVAGCQNGKLCRFQALVGGTPGKRREPAEQRCTHVRRCSEASRPRWAAWSFSLLSKLRLVRSVPDTSFDSPDVPACAVPVKAASRLVPFRFGAVQEFSVLSL